MTFHILGIIIPTDELIFFRGVGIPPTSDYHGDVILDMGYKSRFGNALPSGKLLHNELERSTILGKFTISAVKIVR